MYEIRRTKRFDKDYLKAFQAGKDLKKLDEILIKIAKQESLDAKYKDHKLKGNYKNHRECHLEADWLLIYRIDTVFKTITFVRIGTHSELFN